MRGGALSMKGAPPQWTEVPGPSISCDTFHKPLSFEKMILFLRLGKCSALGPGGPSSPGPSRPQDCWAQRRYLFSVLLFVFQSSPKSLFVFQSFYLFFSPLLFVLQWPPESLFVFQSFAICFTVASRKLICFSVLLFVFQSFAICLICVSVLLFVFP